MTRTKQGRINHRQTGMARVGAETALSVTITKKRSPP
jgi:hypothetical protein